MYLHHTILHSDGIDGKSVTLQKELLHDNNIRTYQLWLLLCVQMVEAIRYLHRDAEIIHNDLKPNNVVLSRSTTTVTGLQEFSSEYQIVIIDFGKASNLKDGKKCQLTFTEKQQHYREFHHVAPEVIEGRMKQSDKSDIYALGKILNKIYHRVERLLPNLKIGTIPNLSKAKECIVQCTSETAELRPHINFIAMVFKDILE